MHIPMCLGQLGGVERGKRGSFNMFVSMGKQTCTS